jgi:hypothetical protein
MFCMSVYFDPHIEVIIQTQGVQEQRAEENITTYDVDVTADWRKQHNDYLQRLFTKCHWNDQINKNEIGGSCNSHGGDEKCVYNFGWKGSSEDTPQNI